MLCATDVWGATYWISEGGTAPTKEDSSACNDAMDIDVHNGETFAGLDIINLCDDGGDFDAALNTPSSGSEGNVITYQNGAGESPRFEVAASIIIDEDYLVFNDITFDGTSVATGSPNYGRVVVLSGADNVTFEGCVFRDAPDDGNAWGVGSANTTSTNILLDTCTFTGNNRAGVYIGGDNDDYWTIDNSTFTLTTDVVGVDVRLGPDNITITDNDITGGSYGIRIGNNSDLDVSSNITITGNTIDASGDGTGTTHPIQVFVYAASDTYVISNNTVTNPADDVDCMELAWQGNPSSVTISNNTITNDTPATGDYGIVVDMFDTGTATITGNNISDVPSGCIYALGGNAHTITGNLCTDGGTAGTPTFPAIYVESMTWEGSDNDASNHTVAYNIINNWSRCFGVNVRDGLTANGIKFYNNTCYGFDDTHVIGAGLSLYDTSGTCDGVELINNIFFDNGAENFVNIAADCQTNFVASNNIYYDTSSDTYWQWGADAQDTTLAAWSSASGDTSTLESDPLFVSAGTDNFKLASKSSPAWDAGTPV